MAKEKVKDEEVICPVGRFFAALGRTSEERSEFCQHLDRAGIEFLKAVRSLVDERIENIEKRGKVRPKKKAVKIKVE